MCIRDRLIRMELSLKSMSTLREEGDNVIVMTHFPPFNYNLEDNSMMGLFEEYGVNSVVFGHLHSFDKKQRLEFYKNNVRYYLTSCDLVNNKLIEIS